MIFAYINWTAVGAIGTAVSCFLAVVMAHVAVKSFRQNKKQLDEIKKQRDEDMRGRLSIEIVSRQDMFLLKISNIGKETAYNINLKFSGELIDDHFSEAIKKSFESFSDKSFCMVAGKELYYMLSPVHSDALHVIKGVSFNGKEINKWLDNNLLSNLAVTGTYQSRGIHKVNESFCINDFVVGNSLKIEKEDVIALEKISKALYCGTIARPKTIQENLNILVKEIESIKKESHG